MGDIELPTRAAKLQAIKHIDVITRASSQRPHRKTFSGTIKKTNKGHFNKGHLNPSLLRQKSTHPLPPSTESHPHTTTCLNHSTLNYPTHPLIHHAPHSPTMSSQLNNPAQWATGTDAPTEKQKGFISTLAASKNADVNPDSLNKSEASQKINELKNAETKNPDATAGAPIQDPKSWATGDDPATGKQMGYIAVMAKEAGEDVPGKLGKSEASGKIEELKGKTGM